MIDRDMMVLQNQTDLEKKVQGPCSETYPTSCDANQDTSIKVEKVSVAEEGEGPVPISALKIKAEPEVRCMSLYVHCKADINKSHLSFLSPSECF
jgi:hypothetical protein